MAKSAARRAVDAICTFVTVMLILLWITILCTPTQPWPWWMVAMATTLYAIFFWVILAIIIIIIVALVLMYAFS